MAVVLLGDCICFNFAQIHRQIRGAWRGRGNDKLDGALGKRLSSRILGCERCVDLNCQFIGAGQNIIGAECVVTQCYEIVTVYRQLRAECDFPRVFHYRHVAVTRWSSFAAFNFRRIHHGKQLHEINLRGWAAPEY